MSTLADNAAKGVKWTGLSSFTNALVKLVQVSILAHVLSPGDFGLIAIAYIFLSLGDILVDMGLTTAVLHFQNISSRQYSSIFWANAIIGVLIGAIIFLFRNIIADYYHDSVVGSVIGWLSLNIVLISISRLHRTYLQKQLEFKKMSIIEMSGSLVMCVGSIILAINGFGVYSLVYGTLISSLFTTIFLMVSVPSLNSQLSFFLSLKSIKEFYSVGLYQLFGSIVEFFSREIDTMFISSYFSLTLLGYYTLCKQLAQRIFKVVNPIIVKVAVPTLALLQDNPKAISDAFVKMIRVASTINYPIYILLAIVSREVLRVLYGSAYISQSSLLTLLAIYYSFLSIGSFTGVLVVVKGKTKNGLMLNLIRLSITLCVCFLSQRLPFLEYVAAMTIGTFILTFYVGFRLTIKRFIPLSFKRYLNAQIVPAAAATLAGLVAWPIWNFNLDNVLAFIIVLVIFMASYVSMSFLFNKDTMRYICQKIKIAV